MSSENAPSDLFPLRLSDFEYYMLKDDRPSHPMVFLMTVHLTGTFSEQPFRESLDELLSAHPLLDCRIENVAGKGWCWVRMETPRDVLSWRNVDEQAVQTVQPEVREIDVRNVRGIHVSVLASTNHAHLSLYLHHACCDGIGSLQLVGELFARYGQKTAAEGAKKPEFEVVDPELLRLREIYDSGESAAVRQKKSVWKIAGKISRLLLRAPVKLACSMDFQLNEAVANGRRIRTIAEPSKHAIQSHVLPKSVHKSLRAAATQMGASINDLFVREMMLQICEWNRRAGLSFGRRWIRLAIPLSMRTGRHDKMPAANVVSYALVTRREADCQDPDALLASIHQQTSDVLFNREGIVCLKLFRVLRKLPGAMKMFLGLKSVLSTMVLANVGDVRRRFSGRFPLQKGRWLAGNVLIEQLHGVAPVRPSTRAAMSIGDYAGDLSISLRTDGSVMSAVDSERFLTEFLTRLQKIAEQVAVSSEDSEET